MITLAMDTSHKFLALALIQNDKVIASVQEECFKQQSEEIFPKLIELTDQAGIKPEDIVQVVISKGPGSYTGVRIAMSIAKVMCGVKKLPLYTLDTLQLYSNHDNCHVLMDARGNRAYFATYNQGKIIGELEVLPIEEIKTKLNDDKPIVGDASLVGKEDNYPDIPQAFLNLKDQWHLEENVDTLVPEYLKDAASYMVKKHD